MGSVQVFLLKDFAKIPPYIFLEHQAGTKMYCSKHDQQCCNWLYALVLNLMTVNLHEHVIHTYNEICSSQHGGITLVKLVLDEIFCIISCDGINTHKNFLNIFESNGSSCIQQARMSL